MAVVFSFRKPCCTGKSECPSPHGEVYSRTVLSESWMDRCWAIWSYNYCWNSVFSAWLAPPRDWWQLASTELWPQRGPCGTQTGLVPSRPDDARALSQRGRRLRGVQQALLPAPPGLRAQCPLQDTLFTSPAKYRDPKSFLEKSETWRFRALKRQKKRMLNHHTLLPKEHFTLCSKSISISQWFAL